ncbi:nuclear transport factor 2 family protein [Spirosoma sp. KNUC1025]|uniref:nuclear transport factor 2 family protein n=1 Tax=Spirosoma sp. KNUC1025 TaxID=2894082 RepID=UPI0038680425|nr:hypothetical protein LN737_09475 [Spirosoma sp. KNUC1025]
MATTKQIIDLVYSTITDSNLSRVLPVLDEQIVLHIPDNVPFGGEYHGRGGFLALMSNVYKLYESIQLSSLIFFAPDDASLLEKSIVVTGKLEGKLHISDEPITVSFIHYWLLSQEKVVELRVFHWDTERLRSHFLPPAKGPMGSANGHSSSENGNLPE